MEKWSVHYPFSLYLGWISVATIANIADVLYYYKWDGFGIEPLTWTLIMLVVGTFLAIVVHMSKKDLVYPLVFVWAYIGIAIKFKDNPQLSGSAWVMAILIPFFIFALDLAIKIKAGSEIPPSGLSDDKGSS